jgi:hypothetical protein
VRHVGWPMRAAKDGNLPGAAAALGIVATPHETGPPRLWHESMSACEKRSGPALAEFNSEYRRRRLEGREAGSALHDLSGPPVARRTGEGRPMSPIAAFRVEGRLGQRSAKTRRRPFRSRNDVG